VPVWLYAIGELLHRDEAPLKGGAMSEAEMFQDIAEYIRAVAGRRQPISLSG
jgi:hypothetical protein